MMKSEVALLYVLIIMSKGSAQSMKPRRSVFFSDVNLKLFKEPDFDGLSSVLVREDIGQLFIGARGKIITLSLDDITKKTKEINWIVTSKEKALCQMKGKSIEVCDNYITLMHTLKDGRILVCGTKAFDPTCTHLMFEEGNVTMEDSFVNGRGKVPFDPNENFASLVNGNTLYTAGSINFLGTVKSFKRHGRNSLMTEPIWSWLNGPNMISMNFAEISKHSYNKEDDSVFLFLTEIEYQSQRSDLRLSRVARVCKSDMGGLRILQRKWTSFLKAHLDCPFGDEGSTSLVQDVFFLQDEKNVSDSIFYATFNLNTKISNACSQSAVCAYKLSDIQQVLRGRFMTSTDSGHWVKHPGAMLNPYPSSCINDEMRAKGVRTSRNVPDSVLMFVKTHTLMEQIVTPITGKPLLLQAMAQFSRIVVDKVTSLDGQQHNVMFISNNSGWVQKAVWSGDDGLRIIEELQLFQDPQPIRFLQLSSRSGQLYSTTRTAVVQLSVRDCSHYTSCADCLIARDPYCGWDRRTGLCAAAAGASNLSMIQNLIDGDVGICPSSHLSKQIIDIHLTLDVAQFLPCSPDTNLPISWSFSGSILEPSPRHTLLSQGLILTPSFTDEGLYTCDTVEVVKGREHRKAVIWYRVKIGRRGGRYFSPHLHPYTLIIVSFGALGVIHIYKHLTQKSPNHVQSDHCGNDPGANRTTASRG
ncbi:semaphorin-4E-like [Gambusia affinis]|uniref:semaphorin-4E-like n=1 Tax=Gambusia affinis TaxID=33528 RepID=UPI001CDBF6EA|nr:semaphorin-4E-like [Gambusia affinis]